MQVPNRIQKKTMIVNNTPSSMNFSNLVPGKLYELSLAAYLSTPGFVGTAYAQITVNHAGVPIMYVYHGVTEAALYVTNLGVYHFRQFKFIATGTTIDFVAAVAGGGIVQGPVDGIGTYAILEEINNAEMTTSF